MRSDWQPCRRRYLGLALDGAAEGGEREVEGGVADGMSGMTAIDVYVHVGGKEEER